MILTDTKIKELVSTNNSILEEYDDTSVTNCGYDLNTYRFYTDDKNEVKSIVLEPGCSVFASSVEIVTVPENMCIRVVLKNSRIRQGLSLDAPIYQPGHKTRVFFRLTNISNDSIQLVEKEMYAMIMFEELIGVPEKKYTGTFDEEFSYKGLGEYQNKYNNQMIKLEKKKDDLKSLESRIYSNVSILLSVFMALFTLLATNIWGIANNLEIKKLLTIDFTLMGCISFLVLFISTSIGSDNKKITILSVLGVLFIVLALCVFG